MSEFLNLSELFGAKNDRYAKAQGDFKLFEGFNYTGDGVSTWDWFRGLGGSFVTVLYFTAKGEIRNMIGRQGVHDSSQDGTVEGTGHAMASRDGLTLSFWTACNAAKVNVDTSDLPEGSEAIVAAAAAKEKVNTGAGFGYRTLRADRILAVNANGAQYVTDTGTAMIDLALSL